MSADLGHLLTLLASAKADENDAKAKRLALEEQIVAYLYPGGAPERGSTTSVGGPFKVTAKFDLNYKADVAAIRAIDSDNLPLKRKPESYELDEAAYERLRVEDPALFAKVAAHVVTKPSKPALTLKV